MTKDWDELSHTWDENELSRLYAARAFSSLRRVVSLDDKKSKSFRVLDFGCGTGLLTEKIAPHVREVFAIDSSKNMIDVLAAKNIPNVTAVCVDIDDPEQRATLPWLSDFDLIVASSVCSFLPDYEATLGLMTSCLGTGGQFVQWDWLLSKGDTNGFTEETIRQTYAHQDLICQSLSEAFAMDIDGKICPVLMGVASIR